MSSTSRTSRSRHARAARQRRRRQIWASAWFSLAGVVLVLIVAVVVSAAHPETPSTSSQNDRASFATGGVVKLDTDGVEIKSLHDLVKLSNLIVVAQASDSGKTVLIEQPVAGPEPYTPNPAPSNLPTQDSDQLKQGPPAAPHPCFLPIGFWCHAVTLPMSKTEQRMPQTTFTFKASQVILARTKANTDQLAVRQSGGPVSFVTFPLGPKQIFTLEIGHDPLFKQGQAEVLFLTQTQDGTFLTVGGVQGRFLVTNNTVSPVDPDSALAQGHVKEDLGAFIKEIDTAANG